MTIEIHGHCDPRFAPVADASRANFDDGFELGASIAATLMLIDRGQLELDARQERLSPVLGSVMRALPQST